MVPHMSVSVCVLFFFVVRGCVSGGWPSSRSGTGGGGGAKGPAWLHACLVERHCLLVLPTPLGVKNVFLVLLGARGWAEDTARTGWGRGNVFFLSPSLSTPPRTYRISFADGGSCFACPPPNVPCYRSRLFPERGR
ncbi:unnamed protein product [Ectocarpus fasciculatus]